MSTAIYYVFLFVISLTLGIYNLLIGLDAIPLSCSTDTEYTLDECTSLQKSYASTCASGTKCKTILCNKYPKFPNGTENIPNIVSGSTIVLVGVPSPNLYYIFQMAIAILYFFICLCALLLAIFANIMANMVPKDFVNISTCKKIIGCMCKTIPPIIVISHYTAMIFLIAYWIMIGMGQCNNSTSTKPGLNSPDRYFNDSKTLAIVDIVFWGALHFGGAILREIIYIEPFMYSPDVGKVNLCKSLLLKKLGP